MRGKPALLLCVPPSKPFNQRVRLVTACGRTCPSAAPSSRVRPVVLGFVFFLSFLIICQLAAVENNRRHGGAAAAPASHVRAV